ncbi:MAG: hypothetical protein U0Q55_18555 [Vicinamibacterales bacterium]
MKRLVLAALGGLLAGLAWSLQGVGAVANDPLTCDVSGYRPGPGLTAASSGDVLTVSWQGDGTEEGRVRFAVASGTPTVLDLSMRPRGGAWSTLLTNAVPDVRVISGIRRMSNQQMSPLRGLGVELTEEIVSRFRWEPFWDAPLDLAQPSGRGGNPPPAVGVGGQPGLPRDPSEIRRDATRFHVSGCSVTSNGGRLEVTFPGVTLGVFEGSLRYTFFRGTNLIQQDVLATTRSQWVAYKYHAGLKGLRPDAATRIAWRDIANNWQEYKFGGVPNVDEVPLATSSRVVVMEKSGSGSVAAFPPPHTFFWAREIAINLGYNFYQHAPDGTFSFGVRQADHEDDSENQANFALYSARPGTTQRMTVFLYPTRETAQRAFDGALTFTHGDRFKPVPGYQVMNHHYHMDLGQRLGQAGSLDAYIPDLAAIRAIGVNIVSQIDSVSGGVEGTPEGAVFPGMPPVTRSATPQPPPPARAAAPPAQPGAGPGGRAGGPGGPGGPGGGFGRGGDPLLIRYNSIEGARRHSDRNFLVMPSQEYFGSPLGGHTDLLFSHPTYWVSGRQPGQPLVREDPKYGKVYQIGNADDLMEMAKREAVLINMPHPRTKGSTGYPDAVKDLPFFADPHYEGIGFRWGMGIDRSEVRLCEYRCLPLLDDMSNWVADKAIPMKHVLAISEVRHQQPGDDLYSSAPVSYVKVAPPGPDESHLVIDALMRGDSYVTSGEVLMSSFAVQGGGAQRSVVADLEWTFPLDFVEVVWGDGQRTNRKIVPTTDLPAHGKKRIEVPFDATGQKWVRFAAWDTAGNGATSQPVRLTAGAATR